MSSMPVRVEAALARLESLPDHSAREAAREALTAIIELHGDGLRRISERLRGAGVEGERILGVVSQDEVVASLLLLHGIHPLGLESRVRRAVGRVRASSHGEAARVEILSVDGSMVRLRVSGSDGLRRALARAIEDAAPEVDRIEVQGPAPDVFPLPTIGSPGTADHARCELCGASLTAGHEHLFEVERRRLSCACTACSLLFDNGTSKLKRVRRQAVALDGFRLTEAQWSALDVPVGLAFFFRSSSLGEVIAAYPGPAGVVQATVPKSAWDELVLANPSLAQVEPDTAALLVHRIRDERTYHLLSIDECFRLAGMVRSRWQGLTGGDGPVHAIAEFFDSLAEARP